MVNMNQKVKVSPKDVNINSEVMYLRLQDVNAKKKELLK